MPKLSGSRNKNLSIALYIAGLAVVSLFLYGTLFTRTYKAAEEDVIISDQPSGGDSQNSSDDPGSITYKTYSKSDKEPVTVLLDAGHGGLDGGNVAGDVLEKDINLAITKKIAQYLEEFNPNIKVEMTRTTDDAPWLQDEETDLNYRLDKQKETGAEYTFSIHANAYEDPSVEGTLFIVNPTDSTMKDLVSKIEENMEAVGWDGNYTIADNRILQLVTMSDIHSTLIELGYMTNPTDLERLTNPEEQDKIAKAIAAAISDYIENNPDAPKYEKPSEESSASSSGSSQSTDPNAQPAQGPNAPASESSAADPNTPAPDPNAAASQPETPAQPENQATPVQ